MLPVAQLLVHCTSVCATAAILTLAATNVYFADVTSANVNIFLNLFQLAAKAHEILITASMTAVVLYFIRLGLLGQQGISYGFLTPGFQLTNPDLLISSAFWRGFRDGSKRNGRTKTIALGALVILATLLVLLSGPSSAILMLPQLNWWSVKDPFSGTGALTFLITPTASSRDIWPSDFSTINWDYCETSGSTPGVGCLYAGWPQIVNFPWATQLQEYRSITPNVTFDINNPTDLNAQALSLRRYVTTEDNGQLGNWAIASSVSAQVATNLGTMWQYSQQMNFTLAQRGRPLITLSSAAKEDPLMSPLVQVQCSNYHRTTVGQTSDLKLQFPGNLLVRPNQDSLHQWEDHWIASVKPASWNYSVYFHISWIELPEPRVKGLVVSWSPGEDEKRNLLACTIYPLWVPVTMSLDPRSDNAVILNSPSPKAAVMNTAVMSQAREMRLEESFLRDLNHRIVADSTGHDYYYPTASNTTLEIILQTVYVTGVRTTAESLVNDSYSFNGDFEVLPGLFAKALSLTVTDALARIFLFDFGTIIYYGGNPSQCPINDSGPYTEPQVAGVGVGWAFGGSTMINCSREFPSYARDIGFVELEWDVQEYGYAWSFNRITVFLAAAVLGLHVLVVAVHVVAAAFYNRQPNRWNKLSEIFSLAFFSPAPEPLMDAQGAGLSSCRPIYSRSVKVRESDSGQSLHLMIDDASNETYEFM